MADKNKNPNSSKKLQQAQKIARENQNKMTIYEGFADFFTRIFRWFSGFIDGIFFNQRYTAIFALLLAVFCYVSVNVDTKSISSSLSSSITLSNVPVSTRYNSESFEVAGIPNACEVVLTGDAANVNNASTKSGYCSINLEGYTEGTHLVKVTAVGYGDSVSAKVTPNEVQVTLKKKTTMQFDLSYDFINQNSLDKKYILGTPEFSSGSKINIRASQDTLNSIALVKALIDVGDQTSDFDVEAQLVAYDKYGQVINAEIVPSSVTVHVKLSSPHKTVPINLVLTGELQSGLAIDTVTMDHQTTEIYASEDVLSRINEITVALDLSTVGSNTDIATPVTLPSGVSSSDVTMVNLGVKLAAAEIKVFENIPIVYRNNTKGYGASNVDLTSVNVTVIGSADNIANITADDIVVYIDVAECNEPGSYSLPLHVESSANPFINLSMDATYINITLVQN